jgi:hypothetical protein
MFDALDELEAAVEKVVASESSTSAWWSISKSSSNARMSGCFGRCAPTPNTRGGSRRRRSSASRATPASRESSRKVGRNRSMSAARRERSRPHSGGRSSCGTPVASSPVAIVHPAGPRCTTASRGHVAAPPACRTASSGAGDIITRFTRAMCTKAGTTRRAASRRRDDQPAGVSCFAAAWSAIACMIALAARLTNSPPLPVTQSHDSCGHAS